MTCDSGKKHRAKLFIQVTYLQARSKAIWFEIILSERWKYMRLDFIQCSYIDFSLLLQL